MNKKNPTSENTLVAKTKCNRGLGLALWLPVFNSTRIVTEHLGEVA